MGNSEGKGKQSDTHTAEIQPSRNARLQSEAVGGTALRIDRQQATLIQGDDSGNRVGLHIERIIVRTVAEQRQQQQQQPTCTYSSTKTQYVTQPFYRCRTCLRGETEGCCAACIQVCHVGHDVCFAGEMNAFCDCGLSVCSSSCKLGSKCTQDLYGEPKLQRWFECNTCWGEGSSMGCCEFCAEQCHQGHRLRQQEACAGVCDCGLNRHRGDLCTFNSTKARGVVQPFYRCYECFSRPDQGCCYPCMKRCHDGHAIKFAGVVPSFCDCGIPGCYVNCHLPKP